MKVRSNLQAYCSPSTGTDSQFICISTVQKAQVTDRNAITQGTLHTIQTYRLFSRDLTI